MCGAGAGAHLPPLLVSPEQVVSSREEAGQRPHREGRGGAGAGGSQEWSKVGRDGSVGRGSDPSRGRSLGGRRYCQSSGLPVGRNDGVWWGRARGGGSRQNVFPVHIPLILDHPLHLEHLGHSEQGRQLVLRHRDLALVHVVQDGTDLVSLHVLQVMRFSISSVSQSGQQSLTLRNTMGCSLALSMNSF